MSLRSNQARILETNPFISFSMSYINVGANWSNVGRFMEKSFNFDNQNSVRFFLVLLVNEKIVLN